MLFGLTAFVSSVLVRPLGGLLLIVLVAIPVRADIGSSQITAFELAIPLCLFIELREAWRQKRKELIPPGNVTVPVLLFYLLAFSSAFWALSDILWLKRVVVLTEALTAGWVVYLAACRLGTQSFVRVIVWSSTIGATWALIWFYALGRPESLNLQQPVGFDAITSQSLRLGSPFLGASNYYASFLILSIPVTFYLCRRSRVHWLSLTIQVTALTATLSRGGALALVLAAAIILAIRMLQRGKLPHGLAVISAATLGVAVAPQVPTVVSALLAQRQETSLTGAGFLARTDLWHVALELWQNHPFVGVGVGNWNAAVSMRYRGGAHNVLLQILAELGIFGSLITVISFCAVLIATWRIRETRLRYCLLAGLLGSFINCLSEATFDGVVFTWFLGVCLGGILANPTRVQPTADLLPRADAISRRNES